MPLGRDGPEFMDISRCRTTTNIVLSCLATIFACTWIALHIDVPESNQSTWKSFWRKLRWMLWALIAPELVAVQALSERQMAKRGMDDWNANFVTWCSPELVEIPGKTAEQCERELKDKEYDSRWTLMHGFLAYMAGIRFYDDNFGWHRKFQPTRMLFKGPKMRPIIQQIGLISSKDIEDKIKGDLLSKLYLVFQTTWFIFQCLARWATHLPVTELEVVTLAYVVLNIFIYFLWWKKPQGLSIPYCFYIEKDEESSENLDSRRDSMQEDVPLMLLSPSQTTVDRTLNAEASPKPTTRCARCRGGRKPSLLTSEWVRVQTAYSGVQGFFLRLLDMDHQLESPLSLALIATIFGGLHLIPIWHSAFPSKAEEVLWWLSAYLITVLPPAIVSVNFVVSSRKRKSTLMSLDVELAYFNICVMSVYSILRITLVVLTFTTLRSLSPEAFVNVEWIRFIPHF